MEQVLFFSRENLQTGQIVYLCTEYINCLRESIWLLKQNFWIQLARKSGWISDQDITEAQKKQHRFFNQGSRIHIGEIFLGYRLLEASQINALLNKAGTSILFCPACRLYFHREIFLFLQEQLCPECACTLSPASCDNSLLKSALRTDFSKPILLVGRYRLKEEDFLFTELAKYTTEDLSELEQETALILQGCDYWISKISGEDSRELQETFVDGISQESIAISGAISQKLLSLDISNQSDDNCQSFEWKLDIPASLVSVFWGYMHNLQELLWLFRQRAFAEICRKLAFLNTDQLQQGIAIQLRALQGGKFLHLGQVLLQTYLLNEEQAICVLQEMGERVFSCSSCGVSLLQLSPTREFPTCPKCGKQCEKAFLSAAGIPGSLAIGFSPFFPLLDEATCEHFSFYKKLPGYLPDFSGSLAEMANAWRAHSGESEIVGKKQVSEQSQIGTLSSMEIKLFMESVDNIRSAEAIYDRYIDMNSPTGKELGEKKSALQENAINMESTSCRNVIPTTMEDLPRRKAIRRKACMAMIFFSPLIVALVWVLASGSLGGATSLSLMPTNESKQQEQNIAFPLDSEKATVAPKSLVLVEKLAKKDTPSSEKKPIEHAQSIAKIGKIVGEVFLHHQNIPGLRVVAVSVDGNGYFSAKCNEGKFFLEVKPGEYRLHLELRNYRWPPQQSVWCYAGKQTKSELELPTLSSIQGIVTIPANGVISRPALTLFHRESEQVIRRAIKISETGEFIAKYIDPGKYRVKLSIAGLPPISEQEVDIAPGICVLVEFKWNLGSIEGYLSPMPKLQPRLALYQLVPDNDSWKIDYTPVKSAYPDESGHFIFSGIKPGRYLILTKGEFTARSQEIIVDPYDSEIISLTLDDNHVIEVRVNRKKRPLANATVIALSSPYQEISRRAITDSSGRVLLRQLPPGDYNILVECSISPERQIKGTASVSVIRSQKTATISIELD